MKVLIISNGNSSNIDLLPYKKKFDKVYCVNNAYKISPWADILYASDLRWWDYYNPKFAGEKWTGNKEAATKYNLNYVELKTKGILSTDDSYIIGGGNSGFQTLNLAINRGAKEIYLIGYDHIEQNQRWFGGYPKELNVNSTLIKWTTHMIKASKIISQRNIKVYNLSNISIIPCFERKKIEDL